MSLIELLLNKTQAFGGVGAETKLIQPSFSPLVDGGGSSRGFYLQLQSNLY